MAPKASAAGIRSVVLLAGLLALSAPSTDAQNTTVIPTNSSGSSDRPVCPVQGDNYCVCAARSCSGCPQCAGCKSTQCIAPPASWTAKTTSTAAGSGRKLREMFSRPALTASMLGRAQKPAAPAARRASRSLMQAAASALVCDGAVRQLDMPAAPPGGYPTDVPWNPPFTNQAGFSCARRTGSQAVCEDPLDAEAAINSDQCCGSAESTTCGTFSFAPITSSGGGSRGIVSPFNPIIYQVTAADAFLTYVEFTAIDVGTAGARLAGAYARNALPRVEAVHNWTRNGPFQADVGNGTIITTYGPCSNCEKEKGIKTLSVAALPGAGFSRIELSQAFADTGCSDAGATNVNADGMLWSGMRYSCILPKCKDVNLTVAGEQPFNCAAAPGPLSWVYNPAAADNTTVTAQSCCLPITCEDTLPLTPEKDAYNCTSNVGPGYKTKLGSQALAANNANCCEVRSSLAVKG